MPYITTERVKQIRENIKKEFPHFKFSITREHMSTVNIVILAGTVDFEKDEQGCLMGRGYQFKDAEANRVYKRIEEIAEEGQRTIVVDGDYGAVPNFYAFITIGKWDKPYQKIEAKKKAAVKKEVKVDKQKQVAIEIAEAPSMVVHFNSIEVFNLNNRKN